MINTGSEADLGLAVTGTPTRDYWPGPGKKKLAWAVTLGAVLKLPGSKLDADRGVWTPGFDGK